MRRARACTCVVLPLPIFRARDRARRRLVELIDGVFERRRGDPNASRELFDILLTIRDDGRGIDPNVLREKAVEKGVLSRSAADSLSDQEAIELIFDAGFSTAKKLWCGCSRPRMQTAYTRSISEGSFSGGRVRFQRRQPVS